MNEEKATITEYKGYVTRVVPESIIATPYDATCVFVPIDGTSYEEALVETKEHIDRLDE